MASRHLAAPQRSPLASPPPPLRRSRCRTPHAVTAALPGSGGFSLPSLPALPWPPRGLGLSLSQRGPSPRREESPPARGARGVAAGSALAPPPPASAEADAVAAAVADLAAAFAAESDADTALPGAAASASASPPPAPGAPSAPFSRYPPKPAVARRIARRAAAAASAAARRATRHTRLFGVSLRPQQPPTPPGAAATATTTTTTKPGAPPDSSVSGAGSAPSAPPAAPSASPPPRPPRSMSLFEGLAPVAAPLWPHLALALTAQLLGACVFLATPRAFGRVLDAVASAGGSGVAAASGFRGAVFALGLLYAGQCVAAFFQAWSLGAAAEKVSLRLRCAAFRAIMRQDVAFFDASASGELVSRLTTDVAQIQASLQSTARGARAIVEALGALAVLSLTSFKLTLVALSVAPVAVLLSQRFGARVKSLSRASAEALADSASVADEAVTNIRTLKSFVREGAAATRYERRAERAYRLAGRIAVATGLLDGLTRAAGNAGALTILSFGGALVAAGELSVGALTSFVIYTLYISSALGTLSTCYAELKRAEGTGARLFALLRREPSIAAPADAAAAAAAADAALAAADGAMESDPDADEDDPASPYYSEAASAPVPMRLTLRNVSFRFPSRGGLVLDDVDIEVAPGQVTALVGPSGSGKSTVAALLQRFYDPEAGAVLLNGVDIKELDPAWLRRSVATVSQEPALFDASIADNIAMGAPPGRTVTRAEIAAAARAANAHDFIAAFPAGYDTPLGERGVALSGGQRQRLAIARAILKDAPVLLLDEATSALDMTSEGLVQEALERLTRGRTTLVIAHRFAALRNAATIVVLDGGRVVERGSHSQLVAANGLYSRMYRLGRFAGPAGQVGRLADWAARVPALLASRVGRGLEERARARRQQQAAEGGAAAAAEAAAAAAAATQQQQQR
jgi:ATP-binding cassette subfamily B protein